MTIDDRQIAALAFLARACRPTGARRWDEGGAVAAIAKIRDRSLAEVVMATIRAAADRDVENPGVIPTNGSHWAETRTVAPTPPPARLGSHERCSVCSHSEPACRMRNAGDHAFLSVDRARGQAADEQTRAELLAQAHAGVVKRAPEPVRPGLAAMVENSDAVKAMKESTKAAREALAEATTGGSNG